MSRSSERAGAEPALLEWLLERAPFGVALFSDDGIVELNAEAARISGIRDRRSSRMAWLQRVRLVDERGTPIDDLEQRPFALALKGQAVPRTRMEVRREDGGAVDVVVQAFPWPEGGEGPPRLAIVLVEDVSWASDAERVQSQWLGAMAHELNGSMQHLVSATAAARLNLDHDRARVVHHLEALERQCRLMGRLVRDFLDAARVRAGTFECRDEPFELAPVLREMADVAETADPRHHITIDVDEDVCVRADADRVKQILTNLLSNAAKYSTPGPLLLGAFPRDAQVVLYLRDQGPGIARDEQEKLFERYRRLPSKQDGSGLGLWIARELARRMGGEMWVESDAENPTTFFVALPACEAPSDATGQASTP